VKSDGRVRGVRADTFVGVSVRPPLILVAVDDRAETRAVPDEGRRMGIRLANARSVRNPISPGGSSRCSAGRIRG
jgi:flavin reductase (DIM6/NTAB) family NADH-FMN oxidoreductase RutF